MSFSFRTASEEDLQRLVRYLDTESVGEAILGELKDWAVPEDNVTFLSMDDMLNHFDEHISEGFA